MARDLGWLWLWRRTGSQRQQAALNFSLSRCAGASRTDARRTGCLACHATAGGGVLRLHLHLMQTPVNTWRIHCFCCPLPLFVQCSYAELGGSLLDDVAQLTSLEDLRAHLRSMRDS